VCSFLGLCCQICLGVEKIASAIKFYMISYRSNDFSVLYSLSKCLFDINNIDEAKFYLEKGVQINDTLYREFSADLLFAGKYFHKNYNLSQKYYLKAKSFGSI
jgi:tetratricopeptide (TPR) repeat protein